MSSFKPLVTDTGLTQQLPSGGELDIPLEERVQLLQRNFDLLVLYLLDQGFDLPEDVVKTVD